MSYNSFKNAYKEKVNNNNTVVSNPKFLLQREAFMYTRVSLIIQKDKKLAGESISLDHQDYQIKEYCEKNNITIVEKFVDASKSGKNIEDRPALCDMLNKLKTRKNMVVICSQVSRLSRNAEDLLKINRKIQKRQATLIILDLPLDPGSLQGEMLLGIMGTIVTLERKANNQKISESMLVASREGKLIKCPKFGYSVVNKEYVENPEEQKIISYIKILLENEPDILPSHITRELKEHGCVNKKGNPLCLTTVISILRELNNPTMPAIIEKQKKDKENKLSTNLQN